MIYGIDAAYPPTVDQAAAVLLHGWSWSIAYIGGPRAANTYTVDQVAELAAAGFAFLPTYVGRNAPWDAVGAFTTDQGITDGWEACELARRLGFASPAVIALDLEYGSYQAHPDATRAYVAAWVSVVNGDGRKACLYSDQAAIAALGTPELVDLTWCADYLAPASWNTEAPAGQYDPGAPPPWDAWQFGNNGHLAGFTFDLNSARDDFPFAHASA